MRFRLSGPGGQVIEDGEGVLEMVAGALVVAPASGQPLRVPAEDIVELTEPDGYGIRVVLRDGTVLDLLQLGRLRGQVLAELLDARGASTTKTLLLTGIGRPEIFPGTVDDVDGELWLYDDALVIVPGRGEPAKLPYPFLRAVRADGSGYRVTIEVVGGAPVTVSRLARRTTEFVDLVGERIRAAGGRTAAFLGVLLPGLGALALRAVSGLLRDGVAGARRELDRIDPTAYPALVSAATLPERVDGLRVLGELGEVWIGFKQIVSVQREAVGVSPWSDPAVAPTFAHDGGASSFGSGVGGMMSASLLSQGPGFGFDGPFQPMGSMLALRMLGTVGRGSGAAHRIQPRADVTRGRLTPASTDHAALSVDGEQPSVLAFALCLTESGRLVYEALNAGEQASYVYRAQGADRVGELNRALDLIGFQVAAVSEDATSAGSAYRKAAERVPALQMLREAYVGRVEHTDDWAARLRKP